METKEILQDEEFTQLLQEISKDAVAAGIKEMGLDKIDQKYLVLPEGDAGKSEKEQLKEEQTKRFGNLAKAIWNRNFSKAEDIATEIKAADPNNMTTDTEGGYLVPDVIAADIIGLIGTFGQARQNMKAGKFPLNVDSYKIPKRGDGLTVYYPGEEGAITASKLSLGLVTLQAKKAAGIAVLTNELKQFATVDFANYIKTRAAEAFATDEDSKVFSKVNTVFSGLFYASNSFGKEVSVADTDSVTDAKLNEAIYGIDQKYLNGASWFVHRTMVEKLRNIVDGNNRPMYFEANDGKFPTLKGYPVKVIENGIPQSSETDASQPFMLLGNLNNSFLQDKAGMRIDLSTEATVASTSLYETDLTALRFIRHWTFHPGLVEGYSVIKLNA